MRGPGAADLAKLLGHAFHDSALLEQALTHPSGASAARPDNQRLEFLGDRVLGFCIAESLLEAFPDAAEGALAPRFNALVRRETLAEVAGEIGLGEHLRLGRSESLSGGRRKAAILADATEAVIAALYLDGGMEAARGFIAARWRDRLRDLTSAPTDAKTRAQEWAQARGLAPPAYRLVERSGPDHAPVFTVEASLQTGEQASGQAGSKKMAEQEAATALISKLGIADPGADPVAGPGAGPGADLAGATGPRAGAAAPAGSDKRRTRGAPQPPRERSDG